MLAILKQERALSGLLFANLSLEGVAHFLQKIAPLMGAFLVLLQILVAAATLWHIFRKWLRDRKTSHAKTTPPDSTGSDI